MNWTNYNPHHISLLKDIGFRQGSTPNSATEFLFAFCSSWQLSVFRRYSSLLCLDATHNTCFALNSNRKAFLHSIVIKNDDAGCGIPVAFMITSAETMVPLVHWLRWLKNTVTFENQLIFMIDCSRTEVAAISAVFQESSIRFCHWHFFRALSAQAKVKISLPDDRNSALVEFRMLLRTEKFIDFLEMWARYETKYQTYPDWISYLKMQWMNDIE